MSEKQCETVLSALQKFLNYQASQGVAPDLLGRWTTEMETQVMATSSVGHPVEEKPGRYSDGMNEWWNIRVPKNAKSDPVWNDYTLTWPLDLYADAIGSTGWDWHNKVSRWVGFDFDSLTGHAQGVGISDADLDAVKEKAIALDYVEVRRSTGGAGLHLYVLLDAIPSENHDVHAAIARCVLEKMGMAANFDFASRVDCCGGNMWLWRRGLDASHAGLRLVKPASRTLSVGDLPSNWRDHIDVVLKKRSKVKLQGLAAEDEKAFDGLTRSRSPVPLDTQHEKLIEALMDTGYTTCWSNDHGLLQTHTFALQTVYEAQTIPIKGVFSTSSNGDDPGSPNCFMYPKSNGRWSVFRFKKGTSECKLWDQDGEGWTGCSFNEMPTLGTAAKVAGASVDPYNGEFVFHDLASFISATTALGVMVSLPDAATGRELRLAMGKNGALVAKFSLLKGESAVSGWIAKGKFWIKGFDLPDAPSGESLAYEYDDIFRQLVSSSGDDAGWMGKLLDGTWCERSKDDIKNILQNLGLPSGVINPLLGDALLRPWKLVNLPFQPEYPSGRQWNQDAAQLAYPPILLADGQSPQHETWNLVLEHLGSDLTPVLRDLTWAREARIHTGGDYLKAWIAALISEPFQPLPYLFFFGPENSGKSLFHESLQLILTKGVVDAFRSLSSEFNGELANAIVCYIDEKDLAKIPGARERVKQYVTSPTIAIRKMRTDAFTQPNATHWVQCANNRKFCPVFKGDTRITVAHVPLPSSDIPKVMMLDRLRSEAPHFMRTLTDWQLPPHHGRLRIPVVETDEKKQAAELNESPLDKFITECVVQASDAKMPFDEFCSKFRRYDEAAQTWTNSKVSKNLPRPYCTTPGTGNKRTINAAWKESLAV